MSRIRTYVVLCLAAMSANGGALAEQKMPTTRSEILEQLTEAGGRVVLHSKVIFGRNAGRVKMLYIPRSSLNSIRPTSLGIFPNLKGLVIIEPATEERPEYALTGCLVDGSKDLAKLELAYVRHGWITGD